MRGVIEVESAELDDVSVAATLQVIRPIAKVPKQFVRARVALYVIDSLPAEQLVLARPAMQFVVAFATDQYVVAAVAEQFSCCRVAGGCNDSQQIVSGTATQRDWHGYIADEDRVCFRCSVVDDLFGNSGKRLREPLAWTLIFVCPSSVNCVT